MARYKMEESVGISLRLPEDLLKRLEQLRQRMQEKAEAVGVRGRVTRTDAVVRALSTGLDSLIESKAAR